MVMDNVRKVRKDLIILLQVNIHHHHHLLPQLLHQILQIFLLLLVNYFTTKCIFMPLPSDQFHITFPHNSLHSSSLFVPSTSSTLSLSVLRIKGPSTSSPFINSATASNATAAASQNLKFKEVLEYDNFGRLIIVTGGDGLVVLLTHVDYCDVYKLDALRAKAKCASKSCRENKIDVIFQLKASLRIKEHLYEARKKMRRPDWIAKKVWVMFLEI
ncbi:hypothetical protein P3L10_030241 [Capsicum annuum]|uniref:uncharacterized protein LOC107852287 n=1 Tax=Capsicum annuum TaxID=4072 RepID=UPI001FB14E41|nr:uncharacterized protein LOC107852287 [Capsicum annuum]